MSFKITLDPSGREFETQHTESILEAGLRSGVNLAYSCQNGSCGDCRARIISGDVKESKFHDYLITEAEKIQNTVLLCCSQALSDCVVDTIEATTATDIALQKLNVKVYKIETLLDKYMVLHLRTPRTKTLRFLAGQCIKMKLPDLPEYFASVASCPCNGMFLQIHLSKNDSHAFVQHVFKNLKNGDKISIEGPYGNMLLEEKSNRPIVMVAVDTGFAPLKSLIEHAIALDLTQAIHLYWITTNNNEHYLENYCRSWLFSLETFFYFPLNWDENNQQHIIDEIIARSPIETEIDLYLSGDANITKPISKTFLEKGTPLDRIFWNTLPKN